MASANEITNPEADFLITYLRDRDADCPACGYNLRDLRSDRCPECGELLALRISPVEPKQAACIAGLVALAAGAGFSALLMLYFFIMVFIRDLPADRIQEFFFCTLGGLIVEGALIVAWIKCWRLIRRLSTVWRWILVLGCVSITLANLIIFTAMIR